ncbi:MAG: response regulator [Oscillospiraceae bacterium]
MDICTERESQARLNSQELHDLGEKLADASDYLTDEARRYSVTGDITHLYNYWHEVYVTQTRDNVITELSAYDPPQNEKELLKNAKKYSDTLIETETVSMKLMLLSEESTASDYSDNEELYNYVLNVEKCDLPAEYISMSKDEMRMKSAEILYDAFYNESKTLIMTPIDEFQSAMNSRLAKLVEEASHGRDNASLIQIIASIAVLTLTGLLILAVNIFYIRPIDRYSESLSDDKIENNISNRDFSRVRVVPGGAYELYRFGEIFNHLSLILYKELKNRTEAEEQMRIARDEADRANDAKTQFFAQMSHELRTPLNAITGYLFLLEKTSLDSKQEKYCKSIRISSDNLLGLINNVLDFSKIESGNMVFEKTDFDLLELLNDVCEMIENTAEQKGLQLIRIIPKNIPKYVKGDPLRLKQVLINLISNAVKFTTAGCVTVRAECMGETDGISSIRFSVRDTGIGISDSDKSRIFEPFVQSDAGVTRKYGGTGLGLPIANMIVTDYSEGRHKIEVDSEQGKGSCFSFQMELEHGAAPKSTLRSDPDKKLIQKDITILLVDDNKINLDVETEILKTFGVSVTTAESGSEAIEISSQNPPDMVLLDLHMPDMDGYETAQRLRELDGMQSTPIIALTADVTAQTASSVDGSNLDGYLSKPFKPDKLCSIIEKHLNIHSVNKSDAETDTTNSGELFSEKDALLNLNGNKDLLISLVERFLNRHINSAEYIRTHIENGNYANAKSIAHDIKGVSGNLCCHSLCRASASLNSELADGTYESLDEFSAVWNETIRCLKDYASKNRILPENHSGSIPFPQLWQKFLSLCQNCDISAADYFRKNRDDFRRNFSKTDFKQLEENVQKYNFDAIVKNNALQITEDTNV